MTPTRPSARAYIVVWASLLVLLVLTFVLAETDLGAFNNVAAIGIAVAKMLLVVLIFMHVRYEKSLTWIFVSAGLIWLLIMFNLTLADYLTRPGPLHYILHNQVGP